MHFIESDISIDKEWIAYHVKNCDVIIPLVGIATPKSYVEKPLAVFEPDFEENLLSVRQCVKHKKRLIFPSTSEAYGLSTASEFVEDESRLVVGPIHKQD